MRVLLISPHFPKNFFTSVTGTFQRLRMWLEALQSLDAELEIVFFRQSDCTEFISNSIVAERLVEHWGVRCNIITCCVEAKAHSNNIFFSYIWPIVRWTQNSNFKSYIDEQFKQVLRKCLERSPDLIFFHRLHAVAAATSLSMGGTKIFLDLDDVEHKSFARAVGQPPIWRLKPLLYLQLPALWWGERQAILHSDKTFVCSESDQRYLQRVMRVRNVEVIPNAVQQVDDIPLSAEPNILFLGTYGYDPNVVAAEYLIREVWPHLTRICPNARLLIAGPHPEQIPSYRHSPKGVEFLGFVSDLAALYLRTRVFCCPIQSGGGTRIKLLEAASYGVPIVATSLGAEGISFLKDEEIILRENGISLAEECADLILNDSRAARIGAAARNRVRLFYNREAIIARMRALLKLNSDN